MAIYSLLLSHGLVDDDPLTESNIMEKIMEKIRGGIKALESNLIPDGPRKATICNFLMDLLLNLGLNDDLKTDGHDNTFGPACQAALDDLERQLKRFEYVGLD